MIPRTKHNCLFYNSEEEYLEVMISYLKEGLENNEFCVWIVPETMKVKDAEEVLRKSIEDFDSYVEKEQILIGDHETVYLNDGRFLAHKMIDDVAELEKKIIQKGFNGICATGDGTWALKDEYWLNFFLYEQELTHTTEVYKFRALCSYDVSKLDIKKIKSIGMTHQSTLAKQMEEWRHLQYSHFSSLQV